MKIRNSFVSNSSSSSFIIGIGKVVNAKKVIGYLGDKLKDDYAIVAAKDWEAKRVTPLGYDKYLSVESFDCSTVELNPASVKPEDLILVVYHVGNEGDWAFDTSGDGDINYRIDSDYFDGTPQEKLLDVFGKPNFIDPILNQVIIGADRNG